MTDMISYTDTLILKYAAIKYDKLIDNIQNEIKSVKLKLAWLQIIEDTTSSTWLLLYTNLFYNEVCYKGNALYQIVKIKNVV